MGARLARDASDSKKPTRDMTNKGMPVTMHAVDRTAHRVQCP